MRVEDRSMEMVHYPPCGPENTLVLADAVVEDLLATVHEGPLVEY